MTDNQESVARHQIPNGQRFGSLRRLLNSCIEKSVICGMMAAVVAVGVLHHHTTSAIWQDLILTKNAIKSLESRFETTVEKVIDKREQDSRAFIKDAIKSIKSRFETTAEEMLDKREQDSRAFSKDAINTLETRLATKMERLFGDENCAALYKSGKTISGVYEINPDGAGPGFKVFCDQKTASGGWTVLQKRLDGTVDFYRKWSDYEKGFGNLEDEFWLGLDKIFRLTKSPSKLRVDLEDFDGNTAYAEYGMFAVANASEKYQLRVEIYSGTAGDSLTQHYGYPFTTKDQDNDSYKGNCAEKFKGGWWYAACHSSNLNGFYFHGRHSSYAGGVNWFYWKGHHYSAKRAEMKIRPVEF